MTYLRWNYRDSHRATKPNATPLQSPQQSRHLSRTSRQSRRVAEHFETRDTVDRTQFHPHRRLVKRQRFSYRNSVVASKMDERLAVDETSVVAAI